MVQTYKTKEAIFEYRKAGSESKLIATRDSLFHARRKHVIGGVQSTVVVVPVSIAVQAVCARLRLDQHHRAITTTKLRGEVICNHLKFFNRRQRHALTILVFRRVVVVNAVNLERRSACAGPVE